MLFDDRERADASPRQNGESRYEFLDRVAGDHRNCVRQLMNDWIDHYPEDERAELIARLKSRSDESVTAAYWELYIHETLRLEGWKLTIHPEIEGTRRSPDFLAVRGDDKMYVELTVVGVSQLDAGEQQRLQRALGAVNEIHSPDFFLEADVVSVDPNSALLRELKSEMATFLAGLDAPQVREAVKSNGVQEQPGLNTRPGPGWEINFYAWPVDEGPTRGPEAATVGMQVPHGFQFVDSVSPFLRRLHDKKKAYGEELSCPYVICVLDLSNAPAEGLDHEIGLYGRTHAYFDVTTNREYGASRLPGGFWRDPKRDGSMVSAVLTAHDLHPATVALVQPALWFAPAPKHPLSQIPAPIWCGRQLAAHDPLGIVKTPAALAPIDLFGLPDDWPGPGAGFQKLAEFGRALAGQLDESASDEA